MPRFALLVGLATSVGCAGVRAPSSSGTAGSTGHQSTDAAAETAGLGGHTGAPGGAYDAALPPTDAPKPITDFPPDPIIAPGAPPSAPTLFGTAGRATGAPCIMSPEPGTLMPRNWLRPRFEYTPTADENLFEITLTVPSFAHHLVIYTTARSYTLDASLWDGLRVSVNDQSVGVSVRSLTLSGSGTVQNPPSPPATADFNVAPVDAPGKIVYIPRSICGISPRPTTTTHRRGTITRYHR
jgi:hypothetical protein